jgi:hypothetical protein
METQPIDLSAGFVPKPTVPAGPPGAAGPVSPPVTTDQPRFSSRDTFQRLSVKPPAVPPISSTPANSQPPSLEQSYESSGLKDIVESAKARSDADEAAHKDIVGHIKAGRWGHATEALLQHVTRGAGQTVSSSGSTASQGIPQAQPPQAATAAPPAPAAADSIDLSAGFIPKSAITPQSITPSGGTSSGDIDLSAGFVPKEAAPAEHDKGIGSQAMGAVKGPFVEVGQTMTGLKDLFAEPQGDEERTIQEGLVGQHGPLGGRIGMAAYRMGHGFLSQLEKAKQVSLSEESVPGKILGAAENAPLIGDIVKKMESGDYGEAITQGLTRALMMKFGTKEGGPAADLPKTATIAGAEIPLKTSQALEAAGKPGLARVAGTVEPIAEKLPGGGVLKKVSEAQQGGAREALANQAADTGAVVSRAPEAIEKNWTDAIAETKKTAQGKYEDIRNQAEKADITPVTTVAQAILDDTETAKLLPKTAREALNKVTKSLSDRDVAAQQIYGKGFNDLDPAKQAEVAKAVKSLGKAAEPAGMSDAMQARSELSDAANHATDANTARLLHQATGDLDKSLDDSLAAHDAANGTDLKAQRLEANQLWAKKYAMQVWRDGLQKIMQDQPSQGTRAINGKAFQELVNRLDPPGGREYRSPLEIMTADNPGSLKDIHELADWMGKNQASAGGGFATMMAKLRMVALPAALLTMGAGAKSTLGLMASSAGLAQILARPGVAGAMLKALQAGVETTKGAVAIGELSNVLGVSRSANGNAAPNTTEVSGFAKPELPSQALSAQRKLWQDVMPRKTAKPGGARKGSD